MINLVTGLPGASKTLYTLTIVDIIAKRDNRAVFYSGITDVTLQGWTEIEAEDWFNCPPNSIIVIDECQRIFRPRMNGKAVPLFVSELETHRHKGLDLYMITQHPMLADSALRRLSGRHLHVVRKFGMQKSTIHEWSSVKDNCDKNASRVDSIKHHWSFNKAMYGSYKSAEVHTVKANVPMRVKLLIALPFLLAIIGYFVYQSLQKKIHPQGAPGPSGQLMTQAPPPAGGVQVSYKNAVDDTKQFLFERTPRVQGLPMTAPRYDEVTKPTTAPVPVACVANNDECRCYSQQATRIQVDKALCLQIVDQGFFRDWEEKKSDNLQRSQAVLDRSDGLPLSHARTAPVEARNVADDVVMPSGRGRALPPVSVLPVVAVPNREPNTYGVVASRRDGVRVAGDD